MAKSRKKSSPKSKQQNTQDKGAVLLRKDGQVMRPQNITMPPAMIAAKWPKGISGNPQGRPKDKFLTLMMVNLLNSTDPGHKHTLGQELVREWYDRAKKSSDLLMLAILDRLEGKLRPDTVEEGLSDQPPVFVLCDMPAPKLPAPPLLPKAIDVKPSSPAK